MLRGIVWSSKRGARRKGSSLCKVEVIFVKLDRCDILSLRSCFRKNWIYMYVQYILSIESLYICNDQNLKKTELL